MDGKRHLSLHLSHQHFLIVGKTGSGKTACSILPTLLNLEGQSMVVTDPGELYEKTSGYLAKQGVQVHLISLGDPRNSDTFNMMDFVQTRTAIRKVVALLIRSALPNTNGNDAFWNNLAEQILVPLWVALVNQPDPKYRNLANLRTLLLEFGTDGKKIDLLIAQYADEESHREYLAFISQDQKVIQNALSTAKAALNLFGDPAIARLTATTSLDLRSLRKTPTVLYIKTPEAELEYYKFLIMVLYSELFNMAMVEPEKKDLPITFLLEEFANCGVALLPEFVNVITTIRKKRCSIGMVVQDIQQMVNLLGAAKTTSIVEGGTASTLYLPKQSFETAQRLERIIGLTARTHVDHTGKVQESSRAVITADEIMALPHNAAIFHHAGYRPALLQLFPYYYSRKMRRRTRHEPVRIVNERYEELLAFIPLESYEKPPVDTSESEY